MLEITLSMSDEALSALHVPKQHAADEVRMLAAVKLFELHRLSSGAASRLAGISRTEFLDRLGQYGVPALDVTEAELAGETRLA